MLINSCVSLGNFYTNVDDEKDIDILNNYTNLASDNSEYRIDYFSMSSNNELDMSTVDMSNSLIEEIKDTIIKNNNLDSKKIIKIKNDKDSYYIIKSNIRDKNIYLITSLDKLDYTISSSNNALGIIFAIMIISLAITFFISSHISSPIKKLSKQAPDVKYGILTNIDIEPNCI